jgi:hypothetical protein
MPLLKILPLVLLIQIGIATPVQANDFDWLKSLSVEAQADPSGFRTRLGARFQVGKVQINTVLSNVSDYGDAYMVLRLSEMSGRRVDFVMDRYRGNKGKGWGVLAKDLGIKPGSREFHQLKRGHDLHSVRRGPNDSGTSGLRGKEHGKGKDKKQ